MCRRQRQGRAGHHGDRAGLRRRLRHRRRRARLRRLRRRQRLRDRGRARPDQHDRRPARRRAGHGQQRGRLRRRRPEPAQHRRGRHRRRTRACRACASTTSRAPRSVSPKVGVKVAEVPGVVTTVSTNGFWFQDPTPDADPATSEGLFVFTRTAPTAAVGDAVTVTGTVSEFRPGGAATNLSTTELTNPVVTVTASGQALPAPTVVGPGGRVPPAHGDRERRERRRGDHRDRLRPGQRRAGLLGVARGHAGLDHRRAGGRPDEPVRRDLGGPARLDRADRARRHRAAGERPQPGADRARPDARRRPAGQRRRLVRRGDGRRRRLQLRQLRAAAERGADAGQRRPAARGHQTPNALQLSVATFNVENLAPTDPQTKFDTLAAVRGAQPAGAGHPGAGGDPGQQRRHRRRRGRRRPDDRQADRGDHRGRRAGVPVPRRSTRSTTPTAASRAATSGWCSCSGPTAGCRSWTGRAARRRPRPRSCGTRPAGRTCRSRRAASTRPARPGPTAASRWRASSAGAARRSSSSRTTSSPRAATTRCTGGSSRSSSPRRCSGCSRRPRCATSSTRSWPPTGTRTSSSSVTSTTSTSPRRSTR